MVEEEDIPTTRKVAEVIIDRKPEETPEYISEITIEKEDVPDTRETTEVTIEQKLDVKEVETTEISIERPKELRPIELILEKEEAPTAEKTVHEVTLEQRFPQFEFEIQPDEETEKRETTTVHISREEETLQPIELVIDVAEEQIEEKVTIEIIRNLTDIETKIGEEVRFVCNIIGYPRPSITWLINRQPVRSDRFITMYELDGTCTLIIKEVIEEDETVYECVAENQAGLVSTQAELIIFSKGKFFKIMYYNQYNFLFLLSSA